MTKFLKLSILFTIINFSLNAQSLKKVLFIGNSYTEVNNVPNLISQMAISTGDQLIYDSNTPGGARFLNHVSNSTTISKINSNNWDYVVLQAQSQETSFSTTQMQNQLYPHATTLCQMIRQNNACSKPLFYMTWGRKNGDASNCPYIPWVCTYQGMDDAINYSYTTMAQNNHTPLAPVAVVWRYLRQHNPSIELYSSDESHPSFAGSYAAACTLYTMIYHKDPTTITFNTGISDVNANIIKTAVKNLVYNQLQDWDFSINPSASFNENTNDLNVNFQNTSTAFDTVSWNFGDGTSSNNVNPTHQYATDGIYEVTLTITKCGIEYSITKALNITSSLNLNDFHKKTPFTVFPNPFNDVLNFILTKQNRSVHLKLYDVIGNLLLSETFHNNSNQINLNHLQSGIYLIQTNIDGILYTEKLIKN